MAVLEPYTSTYTDVDGSIMDADDLVNEFWRVAYFLELWGGAIDAIGQETSYEVYIETVEGELAEILPQRGLIQRLEVAADVESFEIVIKEHTAGAPYRVFITVRCRSANTTFKIRSPAGESHIFGLNRQVLKPSQVITDGFYTAQLICTYGSENGVMVQAFSSNTEETEVNADDVLTAVPQ
jgi:hypothetical protein